MNNEITNHVDTYQKQDIGYNPTLNYKTNPTPENLYNEDARPDITAMEETEEKVNSSKESKSFEDYANEFGHYSGDVKGPSPDGLVTIQSDGKEGLEYANEELEIKELTEEFSQSGDTLEY